ncbi:uncharacterized protein [Argopecten irradians]|uniref:uncharacterized protein n=1 Tax=Argopecten irradians TaxID=31199 RepID=UPI00372308F7
MILVPDQSENDTCCGIVGCFALLIVTKHITEPQISHLLVDLHSRQLVHKDLLKMMSKHNLVFFLVIFAGVCPDQGNCFCWSDALLAAGAGAAAFVAAPVVVPAALGAVGFSAAGTAAGSAGAALMSTYGGSIAAGSAVSVMQSVGAAGIGVAGKAVAGTVAAGVAYTMAGGNCDPKVEKCEP